MTVGNAGYFFSMGKSWLLVLFDPFREEHVMELERWID